MIRVRTALTRELETLLNSVPNVPDSQIINDAEYGQVLDRGRVTDKKGIMRGSIQAPEGFFRAFIAEYEALAIRAVSAELEDADDLYTGLSNGLNAAALACMSVLASRSPIATGRFRNAWQVIETDGNIVEASKVAGKSEAQLRTERRAYAKEYRQRKKASKK